MLREQLFERLSKIPEHPDNVLLLTHTDLDGAGAAVLISAAFPNSNVDIKHCNNKEMSDCILTALKEQSCDYDLIMVTDISLTEEDARIADGFVHENFLLFDHHPTAMHLNKYNWACVHNGKIEDSSRATYYDLADDWHTSATGLLFDYLAYHKFDCILNSPKLNYFAYAVSAYDTWDWKTTKCKKDYIQELSTLCSIYGLSRFERAMSLRIAANEDLLLPIDRLLFEIEQERVDTYISKIKDSIVTGTVDILGKKYSYAGCISTDYVAPVFQYLRDNYPSYDILIINTGASVSLRTNTDVDLAVIAKHFGGGGHVAASGFPQDLKTINTILELPFRHKSSVTASDSASRTSVFGTNKSGITVNIEETIIHSFTVDATSMEEAEELAKAMFDAGEIPAGVPGVKQMQIDDNRSGESTEWFEF